MCQICRREAPRVLWRRRLRDTSTQPASHTRHAEVKVPVRQPKQPCRCTKLCNRGPERSESLAPHEPLRPFTRPAKTCHLSERMLHIRAIPPDPSLSELHLVRSFILPLLHVHLGKEQSSSLTVNDRACLACDADPPGDRCVLPGTVFVCSRHRQTRIPLSMCAWQFQRHCNEPKRALRQAATLDNKRLCQSLSPPGRSTEHSRDQYVYPRVSTNGLNRSTQLRHLGWRDLPNFYSDSYFNTPVSSVLPQSVLVTRPCK